MQNEDIGEEAVNISQKECATVLPQLVFERNLFNEIYKSHISGIGTHIVYS